jgi:hypothetical protein
VPRSRKREWGRSSMTTGRGGPGAGSGARGRPVGLTRGRMQRSRV